MKLIDQFLMVGHDLSILSYVSGESENPEVNLTLEEETRSQLNYAQVISVPEGWFVYAQKRSGIGQVVTLATRSNGSTIGTLSQSCRDVGPTR